MSLLVRYIKSGNWDAINKDTPEDLAFPAAILSNMLEGKNELSVWEVDDLDGSDMGYVVAALHAPGVSGLSDMSFRVISDWLVKKLGLTMRKTPGTSLDTTLNRANKHWIISVSTVGEAIKLAKGFKERESKSFSQADVIRRFAISLQEKRISTERVGVGLWKKLLENGHLQARLD